MSANIFPATLKTRTVSPNGVPSVAFAFARQYSRNSTASIAASANSRGNDLDQMLDRDPFLLHRIAIAQRDGVAQFFAFLAQGFEIDCHAEWRPDFVLPAVTPSNRTAFVVKQIQVRP